jgi:hypothetical protein
MTTTPMYPHPHHAHWTESAAALLALGSAKAFTRCLPPPSNQLTMQKDLPSTRPLPSVVGFTVLLPAIGSLPQANPFDLAPLRHLLSAGSKGNFPGSNVTEQSDFPRVEITAPLLLRKKLVPARVGHASESTRQFTNSDHA